MSFGNRPLKEQDRKPREPDDHGKFCPLCDGKGYVKVNTGTPYVDFCKCPRCEGIGLVYEDR